MHTLLKTDRPHPSVPRQPAGNRRATPAGQAVAPAEPPCPCASASDRLGLVIAHEVNQPLAAIALHTAAARKWLCRAEPDIERALESLALIGAASRQAGDIVRGMQRQAAGQPLETAQVPVDAAVQDALQALCWPMRKNGIAVDAFFGLGGCRISANRVQVQQVVSNLLVNAIEALAASGGVRPPRIRVETRRHGGEVEIAVADNGPGIAPARHARVVASLAGSADNPAGTGNGSGLGLAISASIVHAHGGRLWFEPGAQHGVCFRVRLPVRGHAAAGRSFMKAFTT